MKAWYILAILGFFGSFIAENKAWIGNAPVRAVPGLIWIGSVLSIIAIGAIELFF